MSHDSVRNPQNYEHLSVNQSTYAAAMDAMEKQEKECAKYGCDDNGHKHE